jgi:trans-aconitate 2-methyltransferase
VAWDPAAYRAFGDERSRPFDDLLARVGAADPATVVDLGCGPGTLTATLARRWPGASIVGIDSSPEMLAQAPSAPGLRFERGDIADWDAASSGADVIVSNAALQWVPGHLAMIRRWAAALPAGGWLAFQVPANFSSPSHALMREVAALPQFRGPLAGVLRHEGAIESLATYWQALHGAGFAVDAWDTSYLHVLAGPDPVLEWVRGTGLRPVLAALDGGAAAEFEAIYAERLRAAYPPAPGGTLYPFLRRFIVARRA